MKPLSHRLLSLCLAITLVILPLVAHAGDMGADSCDPTAMMTVDESSGSAMSDDCDVEMDTCNCASEAGCHSNMASSVVALVCKLPGFISAHQGCDSFSYQTIYQAFVPSPDSPPPIV